jgi:hypothetical protein
MCAFVLIFHKAHAHGVPHGARIRMRSSRDGEQRTPLQLQLGVTYKVGQAVCLRNDTSNHIETSAFLCSLPPTFQTRLIRPKLRSQTSSTSSSSSSSLEEPSPSRRSAALRPRRPASSSSSSSSSSTLSSSAFILSSPSSSSS